MNVYYNKYLKYKNKYLQLKKKLTGKGKDDENVVMVDKVDENDDMVDIVDVGMGDVAMGDVDISLIEKYKNMRQNTHRVLKKNKNTILNMPRKIREALYSYSRLGEDGNEIDEKTKNNILDAFDIIEPLDEPITIFRGISSPTSNIILDIPYFVSTSASFSIAQKFLGDNTCCLCIINVPVGAKVIYIPKEIHYHDDDEEEILLQGNTTFSMLEFDKRREEYTLQYNLPSLQKLDLFKLIKIRNEIKHIEELNNFAIMLGSKKNKVIEYETANTFTKFLETNRHKAEIFFNILIDELKPYPFEIEERPYDQLIDVDLFFMDEMPEKKWDIPKGVQFARISIMLLFLIITTYRYLTESIGLILPKNEPYINIKLCCDHLKLDEYYVFDRLGAYKLDSISYNIALQFNIPKHSDSEYRIKFLHLLMNDTNQTTKKRRLELLRSSLIFLNAEYSYIVREYLKKNSN